MADTKNTQQLETDNFEDAKKTEIQQPDDASTDDLEKVTGGFTLHHRLGRMSDYLGN